MSPIAAHPGGEGPGAELLHTARALAADAAGAEVIAGLRAAGLDSILLKGATTAQWLYEDEPRPYVDADILVDPGRVLEAAGILEQLGFRPVEQHVSEHGHPWRRSSDGAEVDLHVSIWGPHLPPGALWDELLRSTQAAQIGSVQVRVLTLPARALHVVLHALQHEGRSPKALEDLRRVIQRAPLEVWLEAERLADRLHALSELGDGLLLDPSGRALLDALPLAAAAARANHDGAVLAVGMARIARARGAGAKLGVVVRALSSPRRAAHILARAPGAIAAYRRRRRG